MSTVIIQRLQELFESRDKHRTDVTVRLSAAGLAADDLMVDTIAMYWDVLEKLAAE